MSSHYTLLFRTTVKTNLSTEELNYLEFIINGNKHTIKQWPDHPYFTTTQKPESLQSKYKHFQFGNFIANFWKDLGEFRGITLAIPSIKSDDDLWEMMLLVDWLCSYSAEDEFVGTFCNDYQRSAVDILFSSGGRLKLYSGNDQSEYNQAAFIRPE